jgi:hypothetical protein
VSDRAKAELWQVLVPNDEAKVGFEILRYITVEDRYFATWKRGQQITANQFGDCNWETPGSRMWCQGISAALNVVSPTWNRKENASDEAERNCLLHRERRTHRAGASGAATSQPTW